MGETFSNSKENEEENDEYFNLVNQIITNEKQNCNNSRNKNKNWKESLLKFLDKQNKNGIDWCKELYDLIKRKKFQNENKFIDLFFWSKFELKTKPNCLNQSSSMFLSNSFNSSHSSSGEKQNINYNNSSNNLTSLSSNNLNFSSIKKILSKMEYENNKIKLQEYIKIFMNHLKNNDHPIKICIELFMKVFIKEISYHLNDIKNIENNEEKINRAKIVTEVLIQQCCLFLFKIQKCFGYYYSKVLPYKYFNDEKEEFTILFTKEFFSYKKFYNLFYELFKISNSNEINNFKEKINKLNNLKITPNDIKINEKFQLNKITENFIFDYVNKNNLNLNEEKIKFFKNFSKDENYLPYQSTIDLIKNIDSFYTPFDKMNLFHTMGVDVIDNITQIWKPIQDSLKKGFLDIDGDELILIFTFILIKSKFENILIHLNFIKFFTTKSAKTNQGYYYSLIEAAVVNIRDLNINLIENEKKLNENNILKEKNNSNISNNSITNTQSSENLNEIVNIN